jgi:putative ABC transport system permease protein
MTLTRFVTKNVFRNKRRSALTVLSITFSLMLLTIMMTIWRGFYLDTGPAEDARVLISRHRVSLTFFLPGFYREKIRTIPGVTHVTPMTWFGGIYKDQKPENFFAQFATDPSEYLDTIADKVVPPDQVKAWQRDRAGALVDEALAKKHGWKIGDRVVLQGTIFPVNPELTIRAMFKREPPNNALYFNASYLEEAVPWFKGSAGFFSTQVDSPEAVTRVSQAIDEMFRNSPQQTKTESEKAFQLGFVAMLGNVKAFILSICTAVVFAILLVSATTMAMSIRERTREVALLKTLGFTRGTVLALFVGEAVTLAMAGGLLGALVASGLIRWVAHSPMATGVLAVMQVTPVTMLLAILVAALVGFISAFVPAYHASKINIVEGLRHIG